MLENLKKIYQEAGWQMEQVSNEPIIYITYKGEHGKWDFVATVEESLNTLVMFARLPFTALTSQYADTSLLIDRVNFGMSSGAWVFDRSDGEIRFRVGINLYNYELTPAYVRDLTQYTNTTMDFYILGFKALLEEGKSYENAYEVVFGTK